MLHCIRLSRDFQCMRVAERGRAGGRNDQGSDDNWNGLTKGRGWTVVRKRLRD
jgi:hypothetical protein